MHTFDEFKYPYFLRDGGEMGQLTRHFNWGTTTVGSIEQWPEALRTMVSVILRSDFPMFLWWGDELVQFYNDAYRPSLGENGKHPDALGQQGKECWPEAWNIIKPLIEDVKQGRSFLHEDQLIPIFRNGSLENVYWTFSYSPVYDHRGDVSGVLVTCMETTSKVKLHNELLESKEQLHFAIEATELGTWDYNPITNKFVGNERLKNWFGLSSEDEVDLSLAIAVIAESDRDRVTRAIRKSLQSSSGGGYDIEYTLIHPQTGEERIVRAKGRAWFNKDLVAIRFNGTLQDITGQVAARNRIEKIVRERTAQLNQSNAKLSQFANVASHDLQEPARKINTFADILTRHLKKNSDERTKEYLSKINSASDRMLILIRDILSLSKISSVKAEFKEVDLNQIWKECMDDYELLIKEKKIKITSDQLPSIQAIPVQMNQLFANLLSNALKFSAKKGKGTLTVKSEAIQKDQLELQPDTSDTDLYYKISFIDNGIGFDPDNSDRIFEIFHRLNPKTDYPGTGIGLAICKRIAETHHGQIYAESSKSTGTVFTIILPAKQKIN